MKSTQLSFGIHAGSVMLLFMTAMLCVTARVMAGDFSPEKDLISLHYDHAKDKDDGHSAAADRTILQSMFGLDWTIRHAVAVSGAYGKNAKVFNPDSDMVMDAVWKSCGGWLSAHRNRDAVVAELTARWTKTLQAGGDVWVKEGGQSDITAAVLERIQKSGQAVSTVKRIHVVQHSGWNENMTTDAALAYVKANSDYISIKDANAYLNDKGGNKAFEEAALKHPVYGPFWKAAFAYYNPKERIDFSDTGELMKILGLGEVNIGQFRERFLMEDAPTPR